MLYRILGIIVLLAFYGCYFAKAASQRKKGITTDQVGKGKTGSVRTIEITMKVATVLAATVGVISILLGTSALPDWLRMLGACVGFAGVGVFVTSVVTMKDSWRAGVPKEDRTQLVTDGIYQISRNPAFLGFDLVYLGIALMFMNWALLAASVFAAVMLHVQIVNVEEPFLLSVFGEEYAAYSRGVCRYIGRKRIKKDA